jgi:DNA-directed RNA polymerase II subunit RPB2
VGTGRSREYHNAPTATKVFVNGVWMGIHRNPVLLHNQLVGMRRSGHIKGEVSIVRDIRERELRLFTDAGRVCRPLFIVDEDQSLRIKREHIDRLDAINDGTVALGDDETAWKELMDEGLIEYLDAEEEETVMIAMTREDLDVASKSEGREALLQERLAAPDENDGSYDPAARVKSANFSHTFTHMEIHPSMILGICASIVPFPDHNQVSCCGERFTDVSLLVTLINPLWASRPWVFT